jgi:hypothetical protein
VSAKIDYFARQLRELVDAYYHQQMTVINYRQERKILLDNLDSEVNHISPKTAAG